MKLTRPYILDADRRSIVYDRVTYEVKGFDGLYRARWGVEAHQTINVVSDKYGSDTYGVPGHVVLAKYMRSRQ